MDKTKTSYDGVKMKSVFVLLKKTIEGPVQVSSKGFLYVLPANSP